ncbi:hypothetical protein BC829DRAFT_137355 [Chytridium lagenaria]|nr:hypothetical protein BC829DRAFT_137355 [Chytridium lagenaria]
MGSVVLGAGKLLVDVGARMVREEPFSGMSDMPVYGEEGEEEELVKRRGREVVVEEEVVTEEEVTREDEVEVQPVVIFDAPVVDLAPVVEDLPVFEDAPVLEDAPLGEDAPVMGDAPILEVISDESDTDDTPQSLYSSAADGIIQMESVPLHTSSPGTFSSEILALLRSPEIVPVTVVNGDDGEVSEDDGKVEREVERKEEDDFVIVEEDEDLGLKSSTLVFPVQQ